MSVIPFDDIKVVLLFVLISVTFAQFILNPNASIPTVIDKKVIGFPVCESAYCFAPSAADLSGAVKAFQGINNPNDLFTATLNAIIGTALATYIFLKLIILLGFLSLPIEWVMRWFSFWGVSPK